MATFTNQATLSYNNISLTSNIVTGEILQVLNGTKRALEDSYSQGEPVTYVISLINSGTVPYTGLTVTDDLGAYTFGENSLTPLTFDADSLTYYVNGVVQTTPSYAITDGELVLSDISVPAGGNAAIIYQAYANEYAPLALASEITNTAEISGSGITTLVSVTETITALAEPVLAISKSISPTSVPENGSVTYTFVITNTGGAEAGADDNVAISDLFNPILDITSVTFNDTSWTSPESYTYDAATGQFSTVPGAITVPAATFTQDQTTGVWSVNPGKVVLTVTGVV